MELLLFHRDLSTSLACLEAGVDGVIVDLETRGKAERQSGFDTQINAHTIETLNSLRSRTRQSLLCRLSGPEPGRAEISQVIDAGADEVIVPMLTSVGQAEAIYGQIGQACKITLMVETAEAVADIAGIAALPVTRVYVGLNDLHISRGTASIFAPLHDGLLDHLRAQIKSPDFGFGGVTLPSKGRPLAAHHLLNKMARLGANFTFLRRSFYRDTDGRSYAAALAGIRTAFAAAAARGEAEVARDHRAMVQAVAALSEAATDA